MITIRTSFDQRFSRCSQLSSELDAGRAHVQVPPPCDAIVAGLVKTNMLRFVHDCDTQEWHILRRTEWKPTGETMASIMAKTATHRLVRCLLWCQFTPAVLPGPALFPVLCQV